MQFNNIINVKLSPTLVRNIKISNEINKFQICMTQAKNYFFQLLSNQIRIHYIIQLISLFILYLGTYIFIIKTMNRTATATPKKNQGYYLPSQQPPRNFGNIINRVDKSAIKPKNDKLQSWAKHEKSYGLENYRPEFHHEEKREKAPTAYKNKAYVNETDTVEPDNSKKETKNREFIAKVQNINKIHDQISSLLKFVKNGSSKSAIKDIEKTPEKTKMDQNRQKMMQHKMKQTANYGRSNEKQNVNYFDLPMYQNEITPITIGKGSSNFNNEQQKIGLSPTKNSMNSDIENYRDKLRKYAQNSKHNELEDQQKRSYRGRPRMQKEKEKEKQVEKPRGNNYSDLTKQKWRENGSSQLRGKQEGRKTYTYRMENKQEEEEILTSKLVFDRQEGNQKYYVNYDKQISKVKQRIQSSSDMVKKMEQKYLRGNALNIDTSAISKNEAEEPKTPTPQREQNKINKGGKQARSNFQLKVFSCEPEKEIKRDEIRRLIADRLSQQIKLDQRLKDARELFNECKIENKWKILQEKLKKLGFSFTEAELESELAISSSQSNPFISQSKARKESIIEQLAQRFAQSQQFWEKKLYQFLSREELEEIQFRIKDMDLDQRGYLTVEDLVCFINLYTSNFFRNRDIIYLFRRMMALGKNRNGVEYEGFLKIISHQ